jgi:hypothetical protein
MCTCIHGHTDNPQCECGARAETVSHYLLWCETYDGERDTLRNEVGFGGMRVGDCGDRKIKRTFKFVTHTKIFFLMEETQGIVYSILEGERGIVKRRNILVQNPFVIGIAWESNNRWLPIDLIFRFNP